MSRKDVTDLLEKIQAHRQSFLITDGVIKEWARLLEPYDYRDVDEKLDEYFNNSENFGRYPDVYYLTKYLKRHDEKLKNDKSYINCQICDQPIDTDNYTKHYDRCSSVDYLYNMSRKYYNKKLNKQKMMEADREQFEKYYWSFCEKLLDVMKDGLQKHVLKNSILSHYGYDIEYDFNSISKEMIK